MRARDKRTATENVRCWCFIVLEKTPKNLRGKRGGGWGLYARELSDLYNTLTPNDPQKGLQMILDRKWSQLEPQMIPNEKQEWLELKLADHRVNLLLLQNVVKVKFCSSNKFIWKVNENVQDCLIK